MNLVRELLRQHINIDQFTGFSLANLLDVLIILFGFQFYNDVLPVFTGGDSFMNNNYIINNKTIGTANTLTDRTNTFSNSDISEIQSHKFVRGVGLLSKPFVAQDERGSRRNGGAHAPRSRKRQDARFKDRVIGFSSRLNSILVSQTFMEWNNKEYSSDSDHSATRLIVEVDSPTDTKVSEFMESRGYDMADNNMDAEKIVYFLKLLVSIVVVVGLVISSLSIYILMLSIYLLVQKNTTKLENLLLIGNSLQRVAMPYQMLTSVLNFVVLAVAFALLVAARSYYMNVIMTLLPETDEGSMWGTLAVGVVLFVVLSATNVLVV